MNGQIPNDAPDLPRRRSLRTIVTSREGVGTGTFVPNPIEPVKRVQGIPDPQPPVVAEAEPIRLRRGIHAGQKDRRLNRYAARCRRGMLLPPDDRGTRETQMPPHLRDDRPLPIPGKVRSHSEIAVNRAGRETLAKPLVPANLPANAPATRAVILEGARMIVEGRVPGRGDPLTVPSLPSARTAQSSKERHRRRNSEAEAAISCASRSTGCCRGPVLAAERWQRNGFAPDVFV